MHKDASPRSSPLCDRRRLLESGVLGGAPRPAGVGTLWASNARAARAPPRPEGHVYRSLALEANIVAIIDGPRFLGIPTQLMDGLIRAFTYPEIVLRLYSTAARSMIGFAPCPSLSLLLQNGSSLALTRTQKRIQGRTINSSRNRQPSLDRSLMAAALPQEPRSDLKSPVRSVGADPIPRRMTSMPAQPGEAGCRNLFDRQLKNAIRHSAGLAIIWHLPVNYPLL